MLCFFDGKLCCCLLYCVHFLFSLSSTGSRHIYTRGFKKTIYMQIIQIMHGIQMCPSSVKVSWAKLFPEDAHEDGDEVEDGGGESFPVLIALKGPKVVKGTTSVHSASDDEHSTVSLNSMSSGSKPVTVKKVHHAPQVQFIRHDSELGADVSLVEEEEGADEDCAPHHQEPATAYGDQPHYHFAHSDESRFHRPNLARGHVKGGFLSDMHPDYEYVKSAAPSSLPRVSMITSSASASALQSETLINKITRRGSVANLEKSMQLTANALAVMALNKPAPIPLPLQQLARSVSGIAPAPAPVRASSVPALNAKDKEREQDGIATRMSSPSMGTRPSTSQSSFIMTGTGNVKGVNKHTVQGLITDPVVQSNLNRTYLKPLMEKPHRQKSLVKRQNVFEAMNAHAESPQMQLYLSDTAGAKPAAHSHIQAFHRTIPIQWCAAGGADTHRKVTISTDLHSEISSKLRRSEADLAQSKTDYHKEKIRAVIDTKNALAKVLFIYFFVTASLVIVRS